VQIVAVNHVARRIVEIIDPVKDEDATKARRGSEKDLLDLSHFSVLTVEHF
jgi:hypothetical protein